MTPGSRAFAALATAFALGGLAACATAPPIPTRQAPSGVSTAHVPVRATLSASRAADQNRTPERSHGFATVGSRSVGPFFARSGDRLLAAWIAPSEKNEEQDLIVAPLALDGAPVGQVHVVAHVPREATSLVVQTAGAPADGWLLAWTAILDRGESVGVLGLTVDGTARGEPVDLQRTSDHLKWAGLVPIAHGAICLWAEETSAGGANILTVAIGTDGKPRGLPMRVATGVERWQAVPAGEGAALALARSGAVPTLSWQRLDPDGHPLDAPLVVARGPSLGGDVDVVVTAQGWLLAWTDRTEQDAQVVLATVDPAGHVKGPTPAMNTAGASALVALVSGSAGAALAWQEPGRRSRENRTLHLALVSTATSLAATPVTSVEMAPGGAPELVATDDGFALLGAARPCETASGTCLVTPLPTFIRFGPHLEPVQTEPFIVGPDRTAAAIGWGLECAPEGRCVALAATGDSPTPIFAVDLAPRTSPYSAPLPPLPPADSPRVTGIATIASGEAYGDVAVARIGDTSVVATFASGLERTGRRRHSRGGRISLRSIDAAGQPELDPTVLTSRASPLGGMAMAPGDSPGDGAAITWVGVDGAESRVEVARIDAHGHTIHEAHLTSAKEEASNVAIAWAGDGWLVAWVDARSGDGEVYVAKVDRNLRRVGREQRITHARGDASDVALAVRGPLAWIGWSDPRESPVEGVGDIFVAPLHASDATRAGDETRVLATARHSRSPVLSSIADGSAVVAWIEDAPTGLEGPSAAMVARLDASAHVVGAPAELPLAAGGRPTAIAATRVPDGSAIEIVVARAGVDGVTLDAIRLRADGTPVARALPLVDLDAPAVFDVALAAADDGVVFGDVGATPSDRRVRRAAVRWAR